MLIINSPMSYGLTFKLFDIYPGPGSNSERDRINHPLHSHAARPPQAKETNLWSLVLWLFLHSLLWPHWEWFAGQRCHLSRVRNWGHSSHWLTGHPFYVEVKPCFVSIQPSWLHSDLKSNAHKYRRKPINPIMHGLSIKYNLCSQNDMNLLWKYFSPDACH